MLLHHVAFAKIVWKLWIHLSQQQQILANANPLKHNHTHTHKRQTDRRISTEEMDNRQTVQQIVGLYASDSLCKHCSDSITNTQNTITPGVFADFGAFHAHEPIQRFSFPFLCFLSQFMCNIVDRNANRNAFETFGGTLAHTYILVIGRSSYMSREKMLKIANRWYQYHIRQLLRKLDLYVYEDFRMACLYTLEEHFKSFSICRTTE